MLLVANVSSGRFFQTVSGNFSRVENLTRPATVDDLFIIQSTTKMMVAAAVLAAGVDKDDLVVDVCSTIPQHFVDAFLENVTVGQLIYHTAKIPDHENARDTVNITLAEFGDVTFQLDPFRLEAAVSPTPLTSQQLLDIVTKSYVFNATGTRRAGDTYSNTGYILLALVLEQATGKDWGRAMDDFFDAYVPNEGGQACSTRYNRDFTPNVDVDRVVSAYKQLGDVLTWDHVRNDPSLFGNQVVDARMWSNLVGQGGMVCSLKSLANFMLALIAGSIRNVEADDFVYQHGVSLRGHGGGTGSNALFDPSTNLIAVGTASSDLRGAFSVANVLLGDPKGVLECLEPDAPRTPPQAPTPPLAPPPPSLCVWNDAMTVHSATSTITASQEDLNGKGSASNTRSEGETSRWMSGADLKENVTLQWDMGSPVPVCSVYIEWEGASAKHYLVQSSDDGLLWEDRVNYTHTGDGGVTPYNQSHFLPEGLVARYVRLYMISPNTGWGYQIYYASVQGYAAPPRPTQPPRPPHAPSPPAHPPPYPVCVWDDAMTVHSATSTVTASHNDTGNGPAENTKSEQTTPPEASTRWMSGAGLQAGVTLQWDMGSPVPVCSVYIEWEGASAQHYLVQSSDDGLSWEDRVNYTYTDDNNATLPEDSVHAYDVRHLLPEGLVARYIRLYMIIPHNDYGYSIWYASVQGYAAPPRPPQPPSPPLPSAPPPADFDNPAVAGVCVNGRGQTATVASGTSLTRCSESITVEGTLVVENDTYIETRRIHVTPHGSVQIGTQASPVSNVTIYLNHDDCESYLHDSRRESWSDVAAAVECLGNGEIEVEGSWHSYGVPKTAWTLLMSDCVNTGKSTAGEHDCPSALNGHTLPHQNFAGCGCSHIHVDECDGWEAGDRIVIAYNLHRIPGGGTPRETKEHIIADISPHEWAGRQDCLITLTAPTDVPHIGNNPHKTFANTLGDVVVLRAEVMHMERSIHITGPMHWRNASEEVRGGQGIATRASGSGEVVMKWHRMTNCGRVLLGKYCHHFHHRHQAGGEITGAVIERSVSKGITIHGTSNVLVHSTNIWNHRGAGIYLENGAEHNNTLMGNVIGCATASFPGGRCSLQDGVYSQADADYNEQSGIYSLSMAGADLIGNHVFMMDNAFFANQAPAGGWGKDIAKCKVAPKATRLPRFEHNVFHDNSGFGWYANIHAPLQIDLDPMGYVTDWRQACPFDPATGADHGAAGRVSHHIEYHNDFSMGSYELGDTSSYNMTTVDGIKAQYWKTYRRALWSGPIMEESVVRAVVQAPGGQGLVEYKNVKWETGRIDLNHHCALGTGEITGGVCASSYFINGGTGRWRDAMILVDEVGNHETSLIFEHGPLEATFFSPNGYPVFTPANCSLTGPDITKDGDYWWKCPSAFKVRPLIIFSPNRGTLTVKNAAPDHFQADGDTIQVPHRNTNIGPGSGSGYMYAPSGRTWAVGYTMLVREGAELEITIPAGVQPAYDDWADDWADYFVMQYSEANWPEALQSNINVTVVEAVSDYGLAGGPFVISSTHSRSWILPYGGMISASGAWYAAKKAAGEAATWEAVPSFLNATGYEESRVDHIRAQCQIR